MAHGDDAGLRLPPAVAPHQVVIVPIVREQDRAQVLAAASVLADDVRAAGLRVRLDDREEHRPGFKFHEWELKGVPCRVEIGARDLAAATATVARRDTGAKATVALGALSGRLPALLTDIQGEMLAAARAEQELRTASPDTYSEMAAYLREAGGFARAGWCGREECEARVKADTAATIRCLPLGQHPAASDHCIVCGGASEAVAVWAQAY
jgi:prolyl-tRNA synthetase